MEIDYRQTEYYKWIQQNPEVYRKTVEFQRFLADNGIAWHNPFANECCSDFGCCNKEFGNYSIRIPEVRRFDPCKLFIETV
jgi:hypothetical protein